MEGERNYRERERQTERDRKQACLASPLQAVCTHFKDHPCGFKRQLKGVIVLVLGFRVEVWDLGVSVDTQLCQMLISRRIVLCFPCLTR